MIPDATPDVPLDGGHGESAGEIDAEVERMIAMDMRATMMEPVSSDVNHLFDQYVNDLFDQ